MSEVASIATAEEVACPGGPQLALAEIERLAERMYEETIQRLRDVDLRGVVKHRITALYGPPMASPDLMLVSFQGSGGDSSPSEPTWPERLLYLDSPFDFGRALRSQFREAGLYDTLATRTVAMAACFPEAPASESNRWMAKRGPRADWCTFSSNWVRRMVSAMRPRAVLLFGKKASDAVGLDDRWRDEVLDSRRWRAFGRAELEGCPAVYCQHLSQGWMREWVQTSRGEVGRVIGSADRDAGSPTSA